ncbi:MAG TPA: serine--tRNA ligase [Methanomicrobiales archaeon]|nr:serine--tRNA ligase [Methanomicrobiales archaeon]
MQVNFSLKADLVFSSELGPEAKDAVDLAVKEANEKVFIKGVPKGVPPEEVGRITAWEAEENILFIGIESGGYTRAHDALFRFRKLVAQALGKHHLGLREIRVREFRVGLTGEVPEAAIPRVPFIRLARREAGRVRLDLQVTTQDLENRIPDRIVKLIEEKGEAAGYGGKTEHWELLSESPKRERTYIGNPTEEMEKRHWIRHGSSRGQWIFGPQPIQLFRAFTSIVEEQIIRPLGFSEMVFPKVDTWDVLSRSGHAKGVYPEIYYVCTPKTRDPGFWEDVADYFKVTGEVPVEMLRERIDGPIGALCYAQCPSFWPFVQGRTIATDSLPVRIFDRSGTSHRYESGGIHGIERVDEFHRIELVWFGTVEQTTRMAEDLHRAYSRVFNEMLELEWRAARVTPWFMAQEGMVGACGCESVGTTDYEAYLPYSDGWLEFQNVSVNGDKYPKGFNVKLQSGEECWSGCSGIGLERWTASFLAQKGFDPAGWPAAVAERVGTLNEVMRFL